MNVGLPPTELFHYTSGQGVLGILRDRRVWATMVHYMNDGEELTYALGIAGELLAETVVDDLELRDDITRRFVEDLRSYAVFAFCLSAERDLLSQWRAYCPLEGGFAIGFSTARLNRVGASQGFQLRKCEYRPEAQRALLRPIVEDIVNAARSKRPQPLSHGDFPDLVERLITAAAAIKHPSFEEEQEWRLLTMTNTWPDVRYRTRGALVIPYYELELPEQEPPDSRVVVGPSRHPDLSIRALKTLTTTQRGWPIDVDRSGTPFRSL